MILLAWIFMQADIFTQWLTAQSSRDQFYFSMQKPKSKKVAHYTMQNKRKNKFWLAGVKLNTFSQKKLAQPILQIHIHWDAVML